MHSFLDTVLCLFLHTYVWPIYLSGNSATKEQDVLFYMYKEIVNNACQTFFSNVGPS